MYEGADGMGRHTSSRGCGSSIFVITSERDFGVEAVEIVERRRLALRLRPASVVGVRAGVRVMAAALLAVEEHAHAPVRPQHDLRRVALRPRLVGELARLDLPLDVELGALPYVLLDDADEP